RAPSPCRLRSAMASPPARSSMALRHWWRLRPRRMASRPLGRLFGLVLQDVGLFADQHGDPVTLIPGRPWRTRPVLVIDPDAVDFGIDRLIPVASPLPNGPVGNERLRT